MVHGEHCLQGDARVELGYNREVDFPEEGRKSTMPVKISEPLSGTPDPVVGRLYGTDAVHRSNVDSLQHHYADMHGTFEVDLLFSGHMVHTFDGFPLSSVPGDVLLIPAWEPHGWEATSLDTVDLVIQFLPEFLGEETVAGASWLSFFARPAPERPRAATPQMREELLTIGQRIGRELEEKPRGWQDGVRIGLLQILLTLSRGWQAPQPSASSPRYSHTNLERIVSALALVHENTDCRVTLGEASATCGLSKRHFATLFRQTMGMTFARFAAHARLKEAARLLNQTDLPVEVVAGQTGFVDHSHLRRSFAKAFGCTPTDYRRLASSTR
ncbi:MAG: helix-turn-helix domain-containing protein [Armatimonadetes bacterium]|nr:helix-turn-helix domain-containing protein [Armatimonadota bacterium]